MLNKKWGIKPIITLGVIIGVVASFIIHYPTYANESFFTRNHIIFYDKNDTLKLCSGSSIGSFIGNFSDLTLTHEGKAWFKDNTEFLKKKMSEIVKVNGESKTRQERYIMAATTAGLPADMWKIVAALDLYERNFDTTRSIHNGLNRIGSKDNIDNVTSGSDYQDDLVQGIYHFLNHARIAKFDPKNTSDWTLDKIANSFLRWNRGGAYHSVNWTWQESGYVNNYSPTYQYNGKLDKEGACKIPSLKDAGLACNNKNSRPGIIHVFNFLNNNFSLSSNSSNSNNYSSSNNSSGTDCSSSANPFANLSGVAAKIMAVYQQYAHQQYYRTEYEDSKSPAWYPKDPSYLMDPILNQYPGSPRGQDCGAWVRFVAIKSGLDPNYGGGTGYTVSVLNWMKNPANGWKQITPHPNFKDISQFQPGDVGLCDTHTYIYIGNGIFSSASTTTTLGKGGRYGRFPMRAGGEECVNHDGSHKSNYSWWRKVQ